MSMLVNKSLSTALLVFYEGTWIYLALTYVVLFLCLDLLFFTVVVLAIPLGLVRFLTLLVGRF